MEKRLKKTEKRIILIIITLLVLWGCAPLPDIVTTEKKPGEAYSADEVRHVTVDQPFLLSGDYFRNRDQKNVFDFDLSSQSQKEKSADNTKKTSLAKNKTKATAKAKTLAKISSPKAASSATYGIPDTPGNAHPVKVGFIMDRDNILPDVGARILKAAILGTADLPVIIGDQEKIEEVLNNTNCLIKKDLYCLSSALGMYPGIRMLFLVETMNLPKKFPGAIETKIAIVDTGLAFRYPIMAVNVPIKKASEIDVALNSIFNNVIKFAIKKSKIIPWFCRPFSRDKEEWYISAGRKSGIKPGDTLKIVARGKLVKSPTGLPAGWIPGKTRGIFKVIKTFGNDFAVCKLVKGKVPNGGDLLMLP